MLTLEHFFRRAYWNLNFMQNKFITLKRLRQLKLIFRITQKYVSVQNKGENINVLRQTASTADNPVTADNIAFLLNSRSVRFNLALLLNLLYKIAA